MSKKQSNPETPKNIKKPVRTHPSSNVKKYEDQLEKAIAESRIESSENRIREEHNEMESRKTFGKKNYMPYESKKLIAMINMMESVLKN